MGIFKAFTFSRRIGSNPDYYYLPDVIELPVECAHGVALSADRVDVGHLPPVRLTLNAQTLGLVNLKEEKGSKKKRDRVDRLCMLELSAAQTS